MRKRAARRAESGVPVYDAERGVLLLASRMALTASIVIFVPALLEHFEAPKAAAVRVLGIGALAVVLASGRLRRSSSGSRSCPRFCPTPPGSACWASPSSVRV